MIKPLDDFGVPLQENTIFSIIFSICWVVKTQFDAKFIICWVVKTHFDKCCAKCYIKLPCFDHNIPIFHSKTEVQWPRGWCFADRIYWSSWICLRFLSGHRGNRFFWGLPSFIVTLYIYNFYILVSIMNMYVYIYIYG